MTDWIDVGLGRIGITEGSAKAVQFIMGGGIVAFSLSRYTPIDQFLPIFGTLFGGYLILKVVV